MNAASQNNVAPRRRRTKRLALRISYDADIDFLWALKFGETIDGQLADETDEPVDGFDVYRRGARGPVIGFGVENLSEFRATRAWKAGLLHRTLLFDVPTLGLRGAGAEEVVLAANSALGGRVHTDVVFFDMAVEAGDAGEPRGG